MGAVGPVLGGWLIDTVGWRAIFLINLPLALGSIVLATLFIRDPRQKVELATLDFSGGTLATAGLGALTWGLTVGSGPQGWTINALLATAAGAILTLVFLAVERSAGGRAMMPLVLFASSSFVGLTVLTFLLYGALGALLVLVPYLLIQVSDYSGTQAGAALLPFSIVLASASPVIGALAGRIGARAPLSIGSMLMGAGFLLCLRIGPPADYWTSVLPATLIIAIGMAGAVAPLTTAVLGSVDNQHTGSASGLNNAVARIGGMVATALLGGVLSAAGSKLVGGFHVAVIMCAVASAAAAGFAFFMIPADRPRSAGSTNGL
jgi:MFS family permease